MQEKFNWRFQVQVANVLPLPMDVNANFSSHPDLSLESANEGERDKQTLAWLRLDFG